MNRFPGLNPLSRFVKMGLRKEGGFVGEHDRSSGEPIPDHLSARWQDLDKLINGLFETSRLLEKSKFNPVLSAAIIAKVLESYLKLIYSFVVI